jgi:hypothetical protein
MGAPTRLAIDGDHSFNAGADPLHPMVKTRFKLVRINVSKHSSKAVMRGDPVGQLQQLGEPVLLRFPKFFDPSPSVRSTDHSAHRDDDDIPQSMQLGSFDPWILYLSKNRFQVSHVSFFHPLSSRFYTLF